MHMHVYARTVAKLRYPALFLPSDRLFPVLFCAVVFMFRGYGCYGRYAHIQKEREREREHMQRRL